MSITTTPINTGSGANIAVDNVGGVGLVQMTKLMDGTAGGTDGIPGDAANGLLVNPSSLPEIDPRRDYAHIGGGPKEIKWARVDINASGDNTIIAGSGSIKYRILTLFLVPDSDVELQVKSGSTVLIQVPLRSSYSNNFMLNPNPGFVCECGAGEAFKLNLDSSIQVGGFVNYVEN